VALAFREIVVHVLLPLACFHTSNPVSLSELSVQDNNMALLDVAVAARLLGAFGFVVEDELPDCVTVKALPAIVIVPVREEVEVLEATE
jgi:hypothetical protein